MSQGWQDDQDGEGFALFDVGTAKINNLISGGVVRAQAATGLLEIGLVTYADIQTVGASRLLGNPTGSTATVSEIPVNAPLFFSGGNLILNYDGTSLALSGGTTLVRAALSGDVAASAGNNTTTIQPHVVTYAKMQQAGAATLLGNPTGSLADVQEITLGTGLSFSGSVLNATGVTPTLYYQTIADPTVGTQPQRTFLAFGEVASTLVTTDDAINDWTNVELAAVAGNPFDTGATTLPGRIITNAYGQITLANSIAVGSGLSLSGGTLSATGGGSGTVTTVTGTAPIFITSTPTTTPNVTIQGAVTTGGTSTSATSLGALASGMLQHAVAAGVSTPSVFAAGSARIPFGSGSNSQLTDSTYLKWNGVNPGLTSLQELQIYNDASTTTGITGIRIGTSAAFTQNFAFSMIAPGWSAGGGLVASDVLAELNAGGTNQLLFSNFGGGPVRFATGGSRTVRLEANASGVAVPALSASGLVKAAVTTGQLSIATAGTDYLVQAYTTVNANGTPQTQRSIVDFGAAMSVSDTGTGGGRTLVNVIVPASAQVAFGNGTGITGDATFTFNSSTDLLAAGNAVGINGVSVPTNASLVAGHTTNTDRDRVQFFVGGGTLGATGTSDNTFFDVIPSATVVTAGVTAGVYATQRIRSLTYSSAAVTAPTLTASLYVDDAPTSGANISGTTIPYAIYVASGGVQFNGVLGVTGNFQCNSTATAHVLSVAGSGGTVMAADGDATTVAFYGVTAVARQTGGSATAGTAYTATEQGMINRMYTALRNYGLLT